MGGSASRGLGGKLARFALYARTARHLHWRQVVYRPIRIAQKLAGNPDRAPKPRAADMSHIPALRRVVSSWKPVDEQAVLRRAREIRDGRFTFLNVSHPLPSIDWKRRYVSHLWAYNLHYFDYAVDLAWSHVMTGDASFARRFEELATGWIEQTADRRGDGWDPYAISLRIVNWTYATLLMWDALKPAARTSVLRSLDAQRSYLARHLEWHILANHLHKNLHGIVIAGALLDGKAVEESPIARELWEQLEEQILEDGGHYERTPMYHAIALRDCLELVAVLRAVDVNVPPVVERRIESMARALAPLTRRNGDLHLFNDSANGIARSAAELWAMIGTTLSIDTAKLDGSWALPQTGFYGVRDAKSGDDLIIDCGELGPTYQPGHAHCDLLSYELDLGGRPVVVDAGVHGYDRDPYREYVRSTRAHNTVMVDGKEQAELWATFRVARRPEILEAAGGGRPPAAALAAAEGDRASGEPAASPGFTFMGAYRPFHSREIVHKRAFSWQPGELEVVDTIEGAHGVVVESFVHLHPDFEARIEGGQVVARSRDLSVIVEPFGVDSISLHRGETKPVQGWHCPEFGVSTPQTAIVMRCNNNNGAALGYRIRSHS